MTEHAFAATEFDASFDPPARGAEDALVVDIDGYEGPLDLLLKLAREQKVDLTKISVAALAQQYLDFIESARRLSLELAADYLVMAAWLAFLKSRLLLPNVVDEGPSGEELAEALAERLRRLEAMRAASRLLMARSRLGVDVFARGMPEPILLQSETRWEASLYDLLSSYAAVRLHRTAVSMQVRRREVLSLQHARDCLMRLLGDDPHWASLDSFLLGYLARPELRRTYKASTLSASLELAREGELELRQTAPFATLYLRRRLRHGSVLAKAANG